MKPISISFARTRNLALVYFLLLLVPYCSGETKADDWPQILGASRDGKTESEVLLDKLPLSGPKVVWNVEVGEGFSGAAIADSTVVLFHRSDDQEIIEARKLEDGAAIWKQSFRTDYQSRISPDAGPRCVPTISNGRVFAFGASGNLHCVELTGGKKLWSRDLFADFRADEGYFGAGTSPLVYDDKVFVNVGGRDGGLVALNAITGKTVWAESKVKGSYSSPILINLDGKKRVLFVARLTTLAVDPSDGSEVFSFPFGERGPTVNGATPLYRDGKLFLAASYGIGEKMVDLRGSEPKEIWSNDESLSSQYPTAILHEGFLYGIHGREDAGLGELRCVDAKNGKVIWSKTDMPMSHLILVKDRILVWRVDGKLRIIDASPKAYRELSSATIFETGARALPALSQGRLVVRTNAKAGKGKFTCIIVGE